MTDPTHQPDTPSTSDSPDTPIRALCEQDGQALDALLAARATGADGAAGPIPSGLGERTDKVSALLGLLEQDPVIDPPADLTARTLAAIRAQEQRKRFSAQVQMLAEPRRTIGIAWHQIFTAAAVFIIGTSLLIPVMDRQQADSRKMAGLNNLGRVGQAMGEYATDNLGQMPRGHVKPGMSWWNVGQSTSHNTENSNSAHLYRLVSNDYLQLADLTCPENAYADRHDHVAGQKDWSGPRAVSFSYQNQYAIRALRLSDAPQMAVLADRTPILEVQDEQIVFNPLVPLNAPSRAHRGAGQNVLTADGVAAWRTRPTVDPFGDEQIDNIWAANGIHIYTGKETPANQFDAFLVP